MTEIQKKKAKELVMRLERVKGSRLNDPILGWVSIAWIDKNSNKAHLLNSNGSYFNYPLSDLILRQIGAIEVQVIKFENIEHLRQLIEEYK